MVPRSAAPAQSHTKVGQLESNLAPKVIHRAVTSQQKPEDRSSEGLRSRFDRRGGPTGPTSTCTRDAATPPFSKFSPDPQKATQRGGGFGPEMGQQMKWKHGQHCISGISI